MTPPTWHSWRRKCALLSRMAFSGDHVRFFLAPLCPTSLTCQTLPRPLHIIRLDTCWSWLVGLHGLLQLYNAVSSCVLAWVRLVLLQHGACSLSLHNGRSASSVYAPHPARFTTDPKQGQHGPCQCIKSHRAVAVLQPSWCLLGSVSGRCRSQLSLRTPRWRAWTPFVKRRL